MKVKVKAGAVVGQDMTQKVWPIDPGTVDTAFDTDTAKLIGSRLKCTAPNFGGKPYGNGAIYVYIDDALVCTDEVIVPLPDENKANVLLAAKNYGMYVSMDRGFCEKLRSIQPEQGAHYADVCIKYDDVELEFTIEEFLKRLGFGG